MNYHDDHSKIGCSMIKVFRRSRREYFETYIAQKIAPWQPTRPAIVGTLCHAVLLEDCFLSDMAALYPPSCLKANGDLNGKPAAEFRDEVAPKIALKVDDWTEVAAVIDAMRASIIAPVIAAATDRERAFYGTMSDIDLKCKPDISCDMGSHVLAYDLKFGDDISPAAFGRSAKRLSYWLQDAHYSHVLNQHYGKPVQFRFFACETKYPYRVQPYWYRQRDREIASDAHATLIAELATCYETNEWSDVWENELTIAPWDLGEEEQLVEFGEAE